MMSQLSIIVSQFTNSETYKKDEFEELRIGWSFEVIDNEARVD